MKKKKGIKAETRMTTSILKQDPNIKKKKRLKKNAIYWDKTNERIFGMSRYKTTLKQRNGLKR